MKTNFFKVSAFLAVCFVIASFTMFTVKAATLPVPGLGWQMTSTSDPFPTLQSLISPMQSLAKTKAAPVVRPLASPGGATIVGWHTFPEPRFFGELLTTGEEVKIWENTSISPAAGFVKGDKFYVYYAVNAYGYIFVRYYICDLETGEILEYGNLNDQDATQFVFMCAYDVVNDVVYAYTYNADGSGKLLQTIDPETRTFTPICDITDENTPQVMGFNTNDGNLYGVSRGGDFVRISKTDGSFETIANTGIVPSNYKQAMTYSPIDRRFVWAALRTDFTACIVSIDPATGSAEITAELPQYTEYTVLSTTDAIPEGKSPERPAVKSVDFENGQTSGSITVTIPSTCYDGSDIAGKLIFHGCLDGEEIATSTVEPGSDVDFVLTDVSEGMHTASFYVTDADGLSSAKVSCSRFFGYDTPLAPANVTLNATGVKWDAVIAGVNGGYVDTDAITYNVYINGEQINDSPVSACEFAYELPYGNLKAFEASVEAVGSGKTSARGVSPRIMYGKPYSVPVEFTFTDDEVALCSVENSNGDNFTWKFDASQRAFYYSYGGNNADDWVFLPITEFSNADALYVIGVDAWARSIYYGEAFEIAYGASPAPEAMTVVGSFSDIRNQSIETFSAYFNIPSAGSYYVGIHCVSPSYMDRLYFNRVTIAESTRSAGCPSKPTDVAATPADLGALSATISFTMPTTSIDGKSLDSDITLTATVASSEESVDVTGKPGEAISDIALKTVQGSNQISVKVSYNGETSEEITVSVFTGLSIPGMVASLQGTVSDDNMSAHITWSAPTWATTTEGYYDTESLRYHYCDYDFNEQKWVEKQEIGPDTEFDFTVDPNAPLGIQYVGIKAENDGGKSPYVSYITLTLGTPYTLPMEEHFTNGSYSYKPIITVAPNTYYSGKCDIVKPEDYGATNDSESNYALRSYPTNSWGTSYCLVSLPKFSTEGAVTPTLSFRVFGGPTLANSEIHLLSSDVEETSVASFWNDLSAEWHDIVVDVPAQFYEKKWVEARIFSTFYPGDPQYTIVDSFKFSDSSSAVDGVAADDAQVKIIGGTGCIRIISDESLQIGIYSTDGTLVNLVNVAEGENSVSVQSGIYVVRADATATKVVVQ